MKRHAAQQPLADVHTGFQLYVGGYRIDENNTKISDYGTNVYVPIPIS